MGRPRPRGGTGRLSQTGARGRRVISTCAADCVAGRDAGRARSPGTCPRRPRRASSRRRRAVCCAVRPARAAAPWRTRLPEAGSGPAPTGRWLRQSGSPWRRPTPRPASPRPPPAGAEQCQRQGKSRGEREMYLPVLSKGQPSHNTQNGSQ